MQKTDILRSLFDTFLESLGINDNPHNFELQGKKALVEQSLKKPVSRLAKSLSQYRSTSMARVYEQVWKVLQSSSDEWAYPLDIFVADDGVSLFSIVAQSGLLYQVPLNINKDEVTLGEWVQVKEEFTPVEQSFRVRRQKDGRYRWLCIAGTTVLNRVGQIDSHELFDSFVEDAQRTGNYPRLDYYHMGETNPEMWDFGTADYLAREGVCYIASGLFDEEHPLAKATIRACENDTEGKWGNSIEFYAHSEPEIILADPEVKIPVYKEGHNSRISVVLEEDAAGLFTRISVANEGVMRTMDAKTKEKLGVLFGADTEGLDAFIGQFEENVDGVNRTVENKNLIHRAKDAAAATTAENDAEAQEEDGEDEDADVLEIDLDEETLAEISHQVTQSTEFKALATGINDIKKLVAEMVIGREKDAKEISDLKKQIARLNQDEGEKKTEYLQDLPARKRTHVTHRPRLENNDPSQPEKMSDVAGRTLSSIPASARY